MPYSNPIVGGTTLVRSAIQSADYVPGVSGWIIRRDGTAEFNAVTVRGSLIVVDPATGSYTSITTGLPAVLASFYAGLVALANFTLQMSPDGVAYFYQVVGQAISTTRYFSAYGYVNHAGQVQELWEWGANPNDTTQQFFFYFTRAHNNDAYQWQVGSNTPSKVVPDVAKFVNADLILGGAAGVDIGSVTARVPVNIDPTARGDLQFSGVSAPRGVVYVERMTAVVNTGAVAGTLYSVFTTAAAVTFQPGRAYQVKLAAQIHSAVAQNPTCNVFEGSIAGTQLLAGPRVALQAGNIDAPVLKDDVVVNATAAPISAALAVGITPQVATLVVLNGAAAPAPSYILVVDVGPASAYPGSLQV